MWKDKGCTLLYLSNLERFQSNKQVIIWQVPANGITWGMSSWCLLAESNLIGMRTGQCQQRDSDKQNHLLWAPEQARSSSTRLSHHFQLRYVSLTFQLSGRTFHGGFSSTSYALFLAATHAYSQITAPVFQMSSLLQLRLFFIMMMILLLCDIFNIILCYHMLSY